MNSVFQLAGAVAAAVERATMRGAFPLVLSGNCAPAAVGCVAGLGPPAVVFWFDAHADFHTPDSTESGFMDGMALATLTGRCWRTLAAAVPDFTPVPDSCIALLGARDFEASEAEALDSSEISRVSVAELRTRLPAVVERFHFIARQGYMHIDLDVLDPTEARANSYAAPNGLRRVDIEWAIGRIAGAIPLGAAAVTAYDPGQDVEGETARVARQLILGLLEAVVRNRA